MKATQGKMFKNWVPEEYSVHIIGSQLYTGMKVLYLRKCVCMYVQHKTEYQPAGVYFFPDTFDPAIKQAGFTYI